MGALWGEQAFYRRRPVITFGVGLVGIGLIALALNGGAGSLFGPRGSSPAVAQEAKSDAKALQVAVMDPKRGSIPELVNAYGTATPTSAATVTESFQRDGQVTDVFVEVGDQVKMGDPLLDFGASPTAVLNYEQAKTTKSLAEHSLARQQQLFKQQLITKDDLENAEKAVSDAQMQIDMYEKIGSVKPSEILTAPFDGVVTEIAVSKGDRVSAGSELMKLSRTDQVILSVGVNLADLDKVKPDLPVHLASLSPDRKPADGKVKRIGKAINMATRQVPVLIDVPVGTALAGENFHAGIEVGKYQGWVVPTDSIGTNLNKSHFVWQIDNGKAKQVPVNIIGQVGKNSIVEGEINSQDSIILTGNYQINEGDAVQPKEEEQSTDDDDDD
ncbi:MAG TPA: efflux RND transporter periplasmic adaptor subunit [Xanthobacteraceae bacterium]|nr:efflux RND transporter periplasmic adaptor subunit [Xanthobacteraceae bacterium]